MADLDCSNLDRYREIARTCGNPEVEAVIVGLVLMVEQRNRIIAERDDTIAQKNREILGEQEARWKTEAALRGKDAAMGHLLDRLGQEGIDCSDLIS